MSKNQKTVLHSRPLQGKDDSQPRRVMGGYQPLISEFSPKKPPPNPPR